MVAESKKRLPVTEVERRKPHRRRLQAGAADGHREGLSSAGGRASPRASSADSASASIDYLPSRMGTILKPWGTSRGYQGFNTV